MQTRREWYQWFSLLTFALTAALIALAMTERMPSAYTALYIAGAASLTVALWLLAWRCDVRLRSERQHAQLMAALSALKPQPILRQLEDVRKLETQKKAR